MASASGMSWSELGRFYREHLVNAVMPFWERHSPDPAQGGFLHRLGPAGEVTCTDKQLWCQGRQTYMFAALHHDLEPRPQWLELAKMGRDFMVRHAHLGDGRWAYETDRAGRVTDASRSAFTDTFVLMGLAGHAVASGSDEDLPLIRRTFEQVVANLRDPAFNEYHHFKLDPQYAWHGPWMALLGMTAVVRPVLGGAVVDPVAAEALDRILHFFARDEERMLFEVLTRQGDVVPTEQGLRTNPGHALESCWFCLEEARHQGNDAAVRRAIEVAGWAFDKGWDRECGGLLGFVSPQGGQPAGPEEITWGERWDHKIWWVHSEALYTVALAARITADPGWRQRFNQLHDFTFAHFPDPEHGEWYEYLDRRTHQPTYRDKGKWIKCAFHIPRGLLKLVLLLTD